MSSRGSALMWRLESFSIGELELKSEEKSTPKTKDAQVRGKMRGLPRLPRFSKEEEAEIRGEAAAMVCGVVKQNFTQLAARSRSRRYWHGADKQTEVAGEDDGRAVVEQDAGSSPYAEGGLADEV